MARMRRSVVWRWPVRLLPLVVLGVLATFLYLLWTGSTWFGIAVYVSYAAMTAALVLLAATGVGLVEWAALRRSGNDPLAVGAVTGLVAGGALFVVGTLDVRAHGDLVIAALVSAVVAVVIGGVAGLDAHRLGPDLARGAAPADG